MTQKSVDRAILAQSTKVTEKTLLINRLIAHALNVSSDRPVYDEDGEFLGHWQDPQWVLTLRSLARDLADIELGESP